MNVIIIDDDKFVTSALKAILEASGDKFIIIYSC